MSVKFLFFKNAKKFQPLSFSQTLVKFPDFLFTVLKVHLRDAFSIPYIPLLENVVGHEIGGLCIFHR